VFKHPTFGGSGRWYGNCEGGLAAARGYGVIRDASGRYIEYLGMARDGVASGVGGMIVRSADKIGAVYYEGSFNNGLPEGTVMIEEAGQRPRIREFRAGRDVGKGSANELQRLAF
jgi:hypothetical protein